MKYYINCTAAVVYRSRTCLTAVLIASTLWICGGIAQGQIPVSSSAYDVAQVYYTDDGSSPFASNTGQLVIETANLGFSSGYINVANANGDWVLQNMPIIPELPYLVSNFNLGSSDGVPISSTSLSVDYSPLPWTTSAFNPLTPISNIGTIDVDYSQGEGVAGLPGALPIINLFAAAAGANRIKIQSGHENVQTAENQCAPAALANGLAWLAVNKGMPLPDDNDPGRWDSGTNVFKVPDVVGGNPVEVVGQSLVGILEKNMNRPSTSRTSGNTTLGQQQNDGLEKYLGSIGNQTKAEIHTQGNIVSTTNNGITNTDLSGLNSTVTSDVLYNELLAEATVKMGYTGHAVDVIATGSVLGVPWVVYQSDLLQTDVDAFDTKLNDYLPFGIGNGLSVPIFSWMKEVNGVAPVLVNQSGGANVFNIIAVRAVPEPAALTLALIGMATVLVAARRRRLQAASAMS